MPRDSVEEAVKWHGLNTQASKRNNATKIPAPSKKKVAAKKIASSKSDSVPPKNKVRPTDEDGLLEAIEVIKDDLRRVSDDLEKNRGGEAEGYFRKAHTDRSEQLRKLEKDYHAIQMSKNEMIAVSDVAEAIDKVTAKLVTELDRLPMRATKKLMGEARSIAVSILKDEIQIFKNELYDFSITTD